MKQPLQPQILDNPAVKHTHNATIHPLNQKTIEKDIQEENISYHRMIVLNIFTIVLFIGLYFLKDSETWQTIITAAILFPLTLFTNAVPIVQLLHNKKIIQNSANNPYIAISENTIQFLNREIYSNEIYSIIHTRLNNISPLTQSEILNNGENILIFTERNRDKIPPYAINTDHTSELTIHRIPLKNIEQPEQLLLSFAEYSAQNNIDFTANESSVLRIANESINIHKTLEENKRSSFNTKSSIEQYDFTD